MQNESGTSNPEFLDRVVDGGGVQENGRSSKDGTTGTTRTTLGVKDSTEGDMAPRGLYGFCGTGGARGSTPPSPPLMDRRTRRQVFADWVAAGSPWPPPAGLASSSAEAAIKATARKGRRPRWK